MNIFTIAGVVGLLIIFLGVALAVLFVRLSRMVTEAEMALEQSKSAFDPNVTLGHEIPVKADVQEQLSAARKLAAKRAAALPRGANMRIGRLGQPNTRGAGKAADEEPFTAVKIAAFHTWQGARTGPPSVSGAEQAAQARQKTRPAPTKKPEDLVPGKDYPFTEITDDMSPDEVRQARIANARARSKAIKELKEQAAAAPAPEAAAPEAAEPEAREPSAAEEAVAAGVEEPEYTEITDDMSADEVRKARIENSKKRSAYFKALKEAGIDPKKVQEGAAAKKEPAAKEAAPAEPEVSPDGEGEAMAVPADVPEPDYIEITDDMPADEVRKARVHNSRERSKYYKALKERGIDPKAVEEQQKQAEPQAPAQQAEEEAEPADEAEAETVEIPANITRPDYREITDDMSADEVRQARVHNSRERSRFFKALKDAGIDPKKVAEEQ